MRRGGGPGAKSLAPIRCHAFLVRAQGETAAGDKSGRRQERLPRPEKRLAHVVNVRRDG